MKKLLILIFIFALIWWIAYKTKDSVFPQPQPKPAPSPSPEPSPPDVPPWVDVPNPLPWPDFGPLPNGPIRDSK